ERGRVELERAGREDDVADVAGERPAELLAGEQPLDLALAELGDVAAVAVEEPDLDPLGVARGQAHRDAARVLRVPDLEAGERHRGQLDVLHVDAGEVEPTDDRALERTRDSARVPAGRDDRALLQR